MNPITFVKSGKHLPEPLRDFHDAKTLFKLMHRTYGRGSGEYEDTTGKINWVLGQCYVVDWFLWFMAQRGWTLQRSRRKVDFYDLAAEIEAMKAEDVAEFRKFLETR